MQVSGSILGILEKNENKKEIKRMFKYIIFFFDVPLSMQATPETVKHK